MKINNDRYFEWIIGEHKGHVKVFDKIESDGKEVYIVFKDGSRINENFVSPLNETNLTDKFMAEIDSPENRWEFKEEWVGKTEAKWVEQDETNPGNKVCVDPGYPGRKIIRLIPPRPTPKTHSVFGLITNDRSLEDTIQPKMEELQIKEIDTKVEEVKHTIHNTDPVYILMSKSKKEDTEISMEMEISLPPKSLYDIAKNLFEDGDKKFIEYIVSSIDTKSIIEALKIAISDMYENKEKISQ